MARRHSTFITLINCLIGSNCTTTFPHRALCSLALYYCIIIVLFYHCIVRPLHFCTSHPALELQDPLFSMPWSVSFLLSKLFSSISFVQNNRAPRRHHHSPHYLLDIKMLQGWMIGSVGSIAMDGADTGDAPAWCRQTVNWFRYLHTFVAEHTMNVNKHI